MSEINCNNCAISDFKESLCHRCAEMKRLGKAEDIEKLLIKAFSEVDSPAKSDCISRQSALDIIKKCYDGISDPFIAGTVCYGEVKALLPEPHIRCKDCKYYRPMIDQDDLCVYREMQVFPDDYCSRAERRTDGTDARSDIG